MKAKKNFDSLGKGMYLSGPMGKAELFPKNKKTDFSKFFLLDLSLFFLLLSNILTIVFAIIENWSLLTIMWIYLFQSIIIGFFNFLRMLSLKEFSTNNLKINNELVEPTKTTKYKTAFFFLVHYGFFHLVYAIFLIALSIKRNIETGNISIQPSIPILISTGIFFMNHLFSYVYNYKKDSAKKKNIGALMFFPYARIIPMHLIIVFGLFIIQTKGALLFFLILKTIADVIMHQAEHNL